MTRHRTLPRATRLHLILELLNRIHCHRRLRGLRTDHLYPRCRRLSAAYLEARAAATP